MINPRYTTPETSRKLCEAGVPSTSGMVHHINWGNAQWTLRRKRRDDDRWIYKQYDPPDRSGVVPAYDFHDLMAGLRAALASSTPRYMVGSVLFDLYRDNSSARVYSHDRVPDGDDAIGYSEGWPSQLYPDAEALALAILDAIASGAIPLGSTAGPSSCSDSPSPSHTDDPPSA